MFWDTRPGCHEAGHLRARHTFRRSGSKSGLVRVRSARLDGQQAIRDYSRRIAASALRIDDLDTVAIHHTDDPEVLIVELVTRATVTTTGHAFTARSIQVFRIRDGKILRFRDYVNPNDLASALGA